MGVVSYLIGVFVFALVIVAPLAMGIALMISARRGGLGYPACGGCQYNLSATVGTAERCPECGSLFTQVGILPPRGPKKPWRFWGGLALTLVPLVLVGGMLMISFMAAQSAATRARAAAVQAQQQAQAAQLKAQQQAQAHTNSQAAPLQSESPHNDAGEVSESE